MQLYLKNLLPRLRQYGKKLDHIELFADRTWVLADDSGNVRTYRFKRNNTLRITVNGNFTDSRWELEGLDAIAVSAPGQNGGEIFRHGFVLNGLLVVQKEGNTSLPTIFYDEAVVPDGDVQGYIIRELITQMQLRKLKGKNYYAETTDGEEIDLGKRVYDTNLEPVASAVVDLGNKILHVSDGRVVRVVNVFQFSGDDFKLEVHSENFTPQPGDKIYRNQFAPPDGVYKVQGPNGRYKFEVTSGVIKKVKETNRKTYVFFGVAAAILIGIVVVIIESKPNTPPEPLVAAVIDSVSTITPSTTVTDSTTTTTNPVSTSPTIPEAPDEYKINELKRVVTQYFDNINSRNWSAVSSVFPVTLKNYFGNSEIHYTEVLQKLKEYWGESRTTGIAYEPVKMQVEPIENGYRVTAPVVERGTEGFYRTPIWVSADQFIDINTSGYIVGVFSKITDKSYDVYRMFNLDESIRIVDYVARNNSSDWRSILNKAKEVGTETPSEFPKYREAILETFGRSSTVSIDGNVYSLGEYLDALANGSQTETYFSSVTSNGVDGKVLSH